MGFNPVDIPAFGGLDLSRDAEDAQGALDLKNVSLASPARLTARPGYTLSGTLDLSGMTAVLNVSDLYLVTAGDANVYEVTTAGSLTTSKTNYASASRWTLVPFGAPSDTATTPAFDNPTFATNTTGWTAATSTITRDTVTYDSTPASGRWDNTGASDNLGAGDTLTATITGTFLAGTQYTATVRVKSSAAVSITAKFGATDYATTTWTGATSFTSYGITWTPATNSTSATLVLTAYGSAYHHIDSADISVPGTVYGANGVAFAKRTIGGTLLAPTVSTQAAGETTYNGARSAPLPTTLAVQPKDNRLVAAGFASSTYGPNGTASSYSHVYFSRPNEPEKWDETDYVVLEPGDGEEIFAACAWNDYLFVFKQTKFFVFYGNSTDATGGTVFNYRTVSNAFPGNVSLYQGQVAVAPDGVYVMTDRGVFRTTGGPPERISHPQLSPLFGNATETDLGLGTSLTVIQSRMLGTGGAFYHDGRLHFSVHIRRDGGSQLPAWLVLDRGQWLIYEYTDTPAIGAPYDYQIKMPSGVATVGRKGLLTVDAIYADDNGTAIGGYYTAPYQPLGGAGAETHVRSSELHGTGTVTLAWGADEQTHDTADSVTMDDGLGYDRTGARGRTLSWKLAFSAAGWTLDRLIPMIQTVRRRA